MDPELFLTEIIDWMILFRTAADVVRFSFIVQPSVSYLDLQLCKNSPISNYFGSLSFNCVRKRLRSFVNTEERCRKFFIPSRELLYTLHLDLAKEREHNLKDVPEFVEHSPFSNSKHVAQLKAVCGSEMLSNLVKEAFDRGVSKLKILKMVLETPSKDHPLFIQLSTSVASEFLNCFYPKIPNCKLFKNFIRHFDILQWAEGPESPDKLEYLLYCMRLYGNTGFEDGFEFELLPLCLFVAHFLEIGPVLNYAPAARLVKGDLPDLENREYIPKSLVEDAKKQMGEERVHRILQIIPLYVEQFNEDSNGKEVEALSLVWKSIPDPYITYSELQMGFKLELSEELKNVHDFYKLAIGESCVDLEPRSLKHLCRTALRTRLWENKLWISEGIKRLPLPSRLQMYLNLDQSLSIPGSRSVHRRRLKRSAPQKGSNHKFTSEKKLKI